MTGWWHQRLLKGDWRELRTYFNEEQEKLIADLDGALRADDYQDWDESKEGGQEQKR